MPIPGWYADPAGEPGRFRYWDGQQWSAGTTSDPSNPAPGAGSAAPATTPAKRSRTPLVVVVVVLVSVALIAAIVIAVAGRQPTPVTTPPAASQPGGFPTGTPSPLLPPSSSSTSSAGPTPVPSSSCPPGDPLTRQPPVDDGRIHGGGLSFPTQSNYLVDGPSGQLSWAYDVSSQSRLVEPHWSSSFAVGALLTTEGFETPRRSAALVLACTAPSPMYAGFTDRKILTSAAVTVDGHKAWAMRAEIHVDDAQTTLPGDVVEVIVVDGDSPESLGMFWACVPIGDQDALAQLDRVTGKLRVD